MPRTKIPKNSKRNRQTPNEELTERLKEIDLKSSEMMSNLDSNCREHLKLILNGFNDLRNQLPNAILSMKYVDVLKMDVKTIDEYNKRMLESANTANSSLTLNKQKKSKDDEGYLTEDATASVKSSLSSGITRSSRDDSRPLGPLGLAKAKAKHRRSQSANTYFLNENQKLQNKRSNLRSGSNLNNSNNEKGLIKRTMSVDRTEPVTPKIIPNIPLSILRYPRIGETIISLTGSPVVAQGLPDSTANVNIPLRNGIISLRPTKMNEVDQNIITQIDKETINQIKQLQSNLSLIMNFANKKGL